MTNLTPIARWIHHTVSARLALFPAVALLGPRQVGKTTLARALSAQHPDAIYLDLEQAEDRRKLSDSAQYLSAHAQRLVVIDEIHRAPELFAELRAQIDARRQLGRRAGHFLILGSAALELLRQSSESLAGRIDYLEMTPFLPHEVQHQINAADSSAQPQLMRLWLRGGFPDSYLAPTDEASLLWRRAFIRSYLERDIPQFGIRVAAETLERLWTMLAHNQGALLNAQRLATSLGVSWHTLNHYLDLMVDLFLIRRLRPWASNAGKRLVKAPKIYLRDCGLLHALLNLRNLEDLLAHPVVGFSWEGIALEALIAVAPAGMQPYFYRTATGNEIDLLLDDGRQRIAIDFKRSSAPHSEPGFLRACEEIGATQRWLVYGGTESYPSGTLELMPILAAQRRLLAMAA